MSVKRTDRFFRADTGEDVYGVTWEILKDNRKWEIGISSLQHRKAPCLFCHNLSSENSTSANLLAYLLQPYGLNSRLLYGMLAYLLNDTKAAKVLAEQELPPMKMLVCGEAWKLEISAGDINLYTR